MTSESLIQKGIERHKKSNSGYEYLILDIHKVRFLINSLRNPHNRMRIKDRLYFTLAKKSKRLCLLLLNFLQHWVLWDFCPISSI